jgi:autotransporter-associated beta strand protein
MWKSKKMHSGRARALLAGAALMTAGSNLAFATSFTWIRAGTNNNWDNAVNWSGGVVPPQVAPGGDVTDIVFSGAQTVLSSTSAARQDYSVNSITYAADFVHNTGTTSFSTTTSSTLVAPATSAHLTIGAGGIVSNVSTFNVAIQRNTAPPGDLILGADQTWFTNAPVPAPGGSAITFTINRPIVGDKHLTKSGTGVLVLALGNSGGLGNSGFTGTLTLSQGSIRTGGLTSDINTHFGSATLVANNAEDFTITASTVNSAGGERTFDNDLVLAGGDGALVFGGSFPLNWTANSTWTLQQDKTIGTSISTTHAGLITGNFGWEKGNGGMMILTGANDYTGVTTVNDGVLQPQNVAALGTTAGGTVVNSGGALELTGQNIVGESLSIAGTGESNLNANNPNIQANAGALRSRSGTNVWSGPVTVTAADTFVATDAGTSLDLPGGVTGDGTSSLRSGGTGAFSVKHVRAGGLAIDAGSTVKINSNGTADGRSTVGTLSLAATADLDLTNNALVVKLDTEANIASLIVAGLTGNGIKSSTAAPNGAIGFATASDVLPAAIFGATDPSDVLVRYTLTGDADLSGTVDIGDFALVAANFNAAGGWSKGDSNYDGTVDIGDFALLAANFNLSAGDLPRGGAVPEPALGLGALALWAVSLRRNRRRD